MNPSCKFEIEASLVRPIRLYAQTNEILQNAVGKKLILCWFRITGMITLEVHSASTNSVRCFLDFALFSFLNVCIKEEGHPQ